MSFKFPAIRYRPTRAADGEGGWTDTLAAPIDIFGVMEIHQDKTSFLVDFNEDVRVTDILTVQEDSTAAVAQYRVTGVERVLGTRTRRLLLERVERPVAP